MTIDVKSITPQQELKLVQEISLGNEQSLTSIILIYQERIRAFAALYAKKLGEEVDDLAQDIFLQVYIAAKNFKGDSLVKTWIYSIAKFTINNKLRKKKLLYFWQLNKSGEHSDLEQTLIDQTSPESLALSDESHQLLLKGLKRLDLNSQEVLLMYEWSGLSYEQISEILMINIGTVKSRLNTARSRLKEAVLMLNN